MSEEKHQVKINFHSKKSANHFITWLCEQGEQDYWVWMEAGDPEEDEGEVVGFQYWSNHAFASGLEIDTSPLPNFFKNKV